jgi:tetratricopeptide (TPR) repeat protein
VTPAPALLRRLHALAAALAALLLVLGQTACAGHESRVQTALAALDRSAPAEAVAALNEEMGVGRAEDLPMLQGDNALLLLDRGNILLSMSQFKLSARDLGAADKSIDLLDMSRGAADDLGKYLFSDDAGPYKAPPYEKLLINTINLMNYLALGDLTGAKVEARRLAIVQKYLRDHEDDTALIGLGSYLAGFAFEKAGNLDEALLYYDDALRYSQYSSLRDPLRVLVRGAPKTPGIAALIAGSEPLPPVGETGEAELLVVVGFGRVPQKVPQRIPIGLALTLVANDISPHDRAQAGALAAKGLVTWVNYPTLARGKGGYAIPTLHLDGRAQPMEEALDIEGEVREAWKEAEGTVILSAITRMIARVVAGEVAQGATEAMTKDGSPLGLLVGLATAATLTAADTPDTRAWSTLPARIAIARLRVRAGAHDVVLGARGQLRRVRLNLRPGGWAFVPMMALR